jgi:hypothetical protein
MHYCTLLQCIHPLYDPLYAVPFPHSSPIVTTLCEMKIIVMYCVKFMFDICC